jgi:hypothetical protein
MSAMMAVLKLAKDRQDTYSSIMTKAHQAIDDKHKFQRRARKYRKQAKELGQAQKYADDCLHIADFRLDRWQQVVRKRNESNAQLMQKTRERDHLLGCLQQLVR